MSRILVSVQTLLLLGLRLWCADACLHGLLQPIPVHAVRGSIESTYMCVRVSLDTDIDIDIRIDIDIDIDIYILVYVICIHTHTSRQTSK